MTTPSRATARDHELETLRAQFHALAPEVQDDFLHALRWITASYDPKLMRALTEASRVFGALRLEAIIRP
jgi:hypothetical protein